MYRSTNIVRVIKSIRLRWADHEDRMKEGKRVFKILAGTPTGKRPLRRPKRRWEDNTHIRADIKVIGIDTRNWVNSAQYSY